MVQAIYSNRKGIYRNLYREIDSDNQKKKSSQIKMQPKGIYTELYKQIKFRNNERKNQYSNWHILALRKLIRNVFSRLSYLFLAATGELKMLIIACMFAKKPINNYIENNISD